MDYYCAQAAGLKINKRCYVLGLMTESCGGVPKNETAFPLCSLQRHGQSLKQKSYFPVILSDGRDASPDLLHQFYVLLAT